MPLAAARPREEGDRLDRRNRRTARWLLVWIVVLMAVSIAVIWLRNR